MIDRFDQSLIGRVGTTRHGERVRVTGPALDPARCTVIPVDLDGLDSRYVEGFTPQVRHITFDAED